MFVILACTVPIVPVVDCRVVMVPVIACIVEALKTDTFPVLD